MQRCSASLLSLSEQLLASKASSGLCGGAAGALFAAWVPLAPLLLLLLLLTALLLPLLSLLALFLLPHGHLLCCCPCRKPLVLLLCPLSCDPVALPLLLLLVLLGRPLPLSTAANGTSSRSTASPTAAQAADSALVARCTDACSSWLCMLPLLLLCGWVLEPCDCLCRSLVAGSMV